MPNPDYRKMFEDLAPFYPNPEDLNYLATVMSGRARFPDADVFVKHSSFLKEKTKPIPAGYTYLAQFITHDISFDERSDRHMREDLPFDNIATLEFIKNLKNLRKPNFDLETVYGYENPTNRGEIPRRKLFRENSPLPFLKLGNTEKELGGGLEALSYPNDLPRGNASVEARIVDPRNDENLLLAQTLVAFIKFHNAMVVKLNEPGNYSREELFEKARKLTIRYYQTIVLTDFLPRIVQEPILKDAAAQIMNKKSFYRPDMFIPLEFAGAAFRFGHSMIRQRYNFNVKHLDNTASGGEDASAALDELMIFTGRGEMNFGNNPNFNCPRLKLPSVWIINWNLFYETDGSIFTGEEKLKNIAEPIDTDIVLALLKLRPKLEKQDNPEGQASSLAALDLFRGRRFGLPTGQDVARKIGATPLRADQIAVLIEDKEIKYVTCEEARKIKDRLIEVFSRETPLWFYILAEAEIQNDGKLGEVGSRIVAETIIQLLYHSEYSILQQEWEDDEDFLLKSDKVFCVSEIKTFGMPEMLRFVQEMNQKHYKELYPDVTNRFDELNPLGNG